MHDDQPQPEIYPDDQLAAARRRRDERIAAGLEPARQPSSAFDPLDESWRSRFKYTDGGPWPRSWLWCQSCGWVSHSGRSPTASSLDLSCPACDSGLCVTPHGPPWRSELVVCRACSYRYAAVWPAPADENRLECPKCRAQDSEVVILPV